MISAFGVDHGYEDIEKFGLAGMGAGVGARLATRGASMARSGAQNMHVGRQMQSGKVGLNTAHAAGSPGAMAHGKGLAMGGRLKARVGLGMGKVGGAMQKRPGLAGGLMTGGAAAGAGGIGASMMNRKKF